MSVVREEISIIRFDLLDYTLKHLNNLIEKEKDLKMTTQKTKENKGSNTYKTALLAVMLARPEGATLAEMAKELGWKENSIRGAMSTLAGKQVGATLTSEKKDGIRRYRLVAIAENVPEKPTETNN